MSLDSTTKRCSKCRAEKPLDAFSKLTASRDGRHPRCRACRSEDSAEYRAANLDECRARSLTYHHTHQEERNAKGRDYYQANRDHVLARTAAYQFEHAEQTKGYQKTYRERHREKRLPDLRRRSTEWREQNRDKDRAASKRWQKANPSAYRAIQHRRRARVRGAEGSYTAAEWEALKAHYEYRCLRCGRCEPEIVLTVDHVIPVGPLGSNAIENIQPLCLSCNCSKQDDSTDYRP